MGSSPSKSDIEVMVDTPRVISWLPHSPSKHHEKLVVVNFGIPAKLRSRHNELVIQLEFFKDRNPIAAKLHLAANIIIDEPQNFSNWQNASDETERFLEIPTGSRGQERIIRSVQLLVDDSEAIEWMQPLPYWGSFAVLVSGIDQVTPDLVSLRFYLINSRDGGSRRLQHFTVFHAGNRTLTADESWTPIEWAAANDWEEGFKYLSTVVDPLAEWKNKDKRTLLSRAAGNGWEPLVDLLLAEDSPSQRDQSEPIDTPDTSGRTPLSWAAGNGHHDITQLLLRKGSYPTVDNDGRSPLSHASANGHLTVVEDLLSHVNPTGLTSYEMLLECDKNSRTSLSWAAGNGHEATVSLLLKMAHDSQREHEIQGRPPLISLLLTTADQEKKTPLYRAAERGFESIVRILGDEEIRAKGHQPESCSPDVKMIVTLFLLDAAANGWDCLVTYAISRGAYLEEEGYGMDKKTPLAIAAEAGHVDVVRALVAAGANCNHQVGKNRDTPLCLASIKNQREVVEILLGAGADIHIHGANGDPMDLATDAHILALLGQLHEDGRLEETVGPNRQSLDESFVFTITRFSKDANSSGSVTAEFDSTTVHHALTGDLSFSNDTAWVWLHLPANNMRWVENLMAKLYDTHDLKFSHKILSPDRWVRRQHHGGSGLHHARFMNPLCEHFKGPQQSITDKPWDWSDENLVLFMPYLHWDLEENMKLLRRRVAHVDSQSGTSTETQLATRDGASRGGNANSDEALLTRFLKDPHPMHIQRTLDQYYYHTLHDTSRRDASQTVSHFQTEKLLEPRVMTIVNQLWLWVVPKHNNNPDTVITCFPGRTVSASEKQSVTNPDPYNRTDPLATIKRSLLHDGQSSVKYIDDLVGLIVSKCCKSYLDSGITLRAHAGESQLHRRSFGSKQRRQSVSSSLSKDKIIRGEQLGFSEIYESSIIDEMERETRLFQAFSLSMDKQAKTDPESKTAASEAAIISSMVDISEEIVSLGRIKDILDELNIMHTLMSEQKKILMAAETVVRSIRQYRGNYWGTSSGPLSTAEDNIAEITRLERRATAAMESVNFLVDLKQKQSNVMDSRAALAMSKETSRQGKTLLIFTIVTIIFLPLSFVASFFTIEISDFQRNSDDKMSLGYVSAIMFPIASTVSAVIIFLAFKVDRLSKEWDWVKRKTSAFQNTKSHVTIPKISVPTLLERRTEMNIGKQLESGAIRPEE